MGLRSVLGAALLLLLLPALASAASLRVGVLAPITNYATKGQKRAAGALLALRHINAQDPEVIPEAKTLLAGHTLTYYLNDTAKNPGTGMAMALWQMQQADPPTGIIGASSSSVSVPIALLGGFYKTPQISYASTSAGLSNKLTYPYFARSISPDSIQGVAMAGLIGSLGLKGVKVACISTDDAYGAGIVKSFSAAAASDGDLSVVASTDFFFNSGKQDVATGLVTAANAVSLAKLETAVSAVKKSGATVLVASASGFDATLLFMEAKKQGLYGYPYLWIGQDGIMSDAAMASAIKNGCQGVVDGILGTRPYAGEGSAKFLNFTDTTWKGCLNADGKTSCLSADMPGLTHAEMSAGMNSKTPFAYDGMFALAFALEAVLKAGGAATDGAAVLAALMKVSFEGVTGPVSFDAQGDRLGGYAIYNLKPKTAALGSVGTWDKTGGLKKTSDITFMDGTTKLVLPCAAGLLRNNGVCVACNAGQYLKGQTAAAGGTCTLCPKGTEALIAGLTVCSPCKPGYYAPKEGTRSCLNVGRGEFQTLSAQTAPVTCPQYTTTLAVGSVNLTQCQCSKGFYRPDLTTGLECYPCPTDGVCLGGTFAPYPRAGYWGDIQLVAPAINKATNPVLVAKPKLAASISLKMIADFNDKDGNPAKTPLRNAYFECAPMSRCMRCTDGELKFPSDPQKAAEYEQSCRTLGQLDLRESYENTTISTTCSAGYDGRLCKNCQYDYYQLGAECLKCQELFGSKAIFSLAAFLLVIFLWYYVNKFASDDNEAFAAALTFLQVLGIITSYGLGWPDFIVSYLVPILNTIQFDIDFFKPECLRVSVGKELWGKYGLGYEAGLYLQLLVPILVGFIYVVRYRIKLIKFNSLHSKSDARLAVLQSGEKAPEGGVVAVAPTGTGAEEEAEKEKRVMRRLTEQMEWDFDNSISRFTASFNVVYISVTARAFEVFNCHQLPDETWMLMANPSQECYTGQHIWFMVIAAAALGTYTLGIPIYFWWLVKWGTNNGMLNDKRYARRYGWLWTPYKAEFCWWELTFLVRRFLFAVVLTFFWKAPLIQAAFSIIIFAVFIAMDYWASPFQNLQVGMIDKIGLLFCTLWTTGGMVFFVYTGNSLYAKQVQYTQNGLVVVFLLMMSWIVYLCVSEARRHSLENAVFRKLESFADETNKKFEHTMRLHKLIDYKLLKAWMQMADVQQYLTFWMVDQWLSEFLDSTSKHSYHSVDNEALFFRELATSVPYLTDFLAKSMDDQHSAAAQMLAGLMKERHRVGADGSLHEFVEETQQSGLLRWLAFDSTHKKRAKFREMLNSMISAPDFVKGGDNAGPNGAPNAQGWNQREAERSMGQKWLKKTDTGRASAGFLLKQNEARAEEPLLAP